MMQTDTSTSTSTLPSNMGKLTNKADIVKRLEELNKWQEEQKKLLEAKQAKQRDVLDMEQKTMYQALGLQCVGDRDVIEEKQQGISHANHPYGDYEKCCESMMGYGEGYNTNPGELENNYDSFSYKTAALGYQNLDVNPPLQKVPPKEKKPFLRRGQGLKQRFKIDPDEFKLSNLPKYKYANAHPQLNIKRNKTSIVIKPKLQQRQSSASATTKKDLDIQEQRFQQLLISSKNVFNSTPDMKSSLASSKNASSANSSNNSSSLPRVRFAESTLSSKNIPTSPPCEGPPAATSHTVAWAKILDPQQIHPIPIIRKSPPASGPPPPPQTEDDIFELMEQKANERSFDMDSTFIKEFMKQRLTEKLNDTDEIPISENLKSMRLKPVMSQESLQDEEEMGEEDEHSSDSDTEVEGDSGRHKTIDTSFHKANKGTTENRVRFSDSNDTREFQENDTITDASANISLAGSPNPAFFQQFKKALFAALQFKAENHAEKEQNEIQKSASDSTITPTNSNSLLEESQQSQRMGMASLDIQEKTNMIKIRLHELETEIATFKENNVQLLKLKQEFELEKATHAQEQLEAKDRLKDEKIQMEIYLHDERMKMEDDKRKFEQQMKTKLHSATAQKTKEMEKLRERINQLEMQLKNKEASHASAQARWRSQIRSLEKEDKRLQEQIEALSKENKRLENEMVKMSRENNNKLLQEINKNISKLAPKQTQHAGTFAADDGLPVLPSARTLSKTIVATAAANKRSTSPFLQKRTKPPPVQKTNNNVQQQSRQTNPLPAAMSSVESAAEVTPDISYSDVESATNKKFNNFEEDDEDILQELKSLAPKHLNNNQITNSANIAVSQIPSSSPVPNIAPPSSPTNLKREIVNSDGSKDIWYSNGNLKKISADRMLIRMLYYNKDIKETNINEGTVKYYYAESNTWHTTYVDGLEILEFPNGQVEHRHKNGVIEYHYPNNSIKVIDPRDDQKQEEWMFPDGTHLVQHRNGDKILSLPNGQKEIHTKLQKRREYPDGTVKIVYPDGSTETRYSNGRVRLKDKDGKLVMDNEEAVGQ